MIYETIRMEGEAQIDGMTDQETETTVMIVLLQRHALSDLTTIVIDLQTITTAGLEAKMRAIHQIKTDHRVEADHRKRS